MHKFFLAPCILFCIIDPATTKAQTALPLSDLSAFTTPAPSWQVADNLQTDYQHTEFTSIHNGAGILLNNPSKKRAGSDLYTKEQFGDVDLNMEVMLPKGSNSGIYLQSRYEVQIADSWNQTQPSASANGAIYLRWDESRGAGNESFDGHAPRVNTSHAPGLWQKLFISFRAPRFDANKRKIANARILRIELNGTLIQENVELTGPTRGARGNDEVAKAPLRFQGDHGPVAFRNIVISNYYGEQPTFSDLKYSLYKGKFDFMPDYSEYEPEQEASIEKLTTSFIPREEDFLVRYTANINIPQAGNYLFQRETNGSGYVKVNDIEVSNLKSDVTKPVHLEAGTYPFEMGYTKPNNWFPTSFGLKISSDNVREFLISDPKSLARSFPDPIHIDAANYPMMRSFIDLPNGKRLVHAISIGGTHQLHYSYDLDNGALFQAWRGEFLDAASMWIGRGDGSAKPLSMPVYFNEASLPITHSSTADTTNTGFVNLGYEITDQQTTIFRYEALGASIEDAIQLQQGGTGLKRTLTVRNALPDLIYKIAEGKNIIKQSKSLYAIDDRKYFVQIDDPNTRITIKEESGKYIMFANLSGNLSYSIIF